MNSVFANHSEEDVIYPLTVKEIAEAQEADPNIHKLTIHQAPGGKTHKACAKEQPWSFLLLFNTEQ